MTEHLDSIATATVAELGGRTSVLKRQRDDHIELDQLLYELSETPACDRAVVLDRICRLVFPHAFAEESVLWPAIRKWVPEGESTTLEIEREHQEINELFRTLEQNGHDSNEGSALLDRIVVLLRADVRDEEDRLFPMLRRSLSDTQLRWLGRLWTAVCIIAPTRPHPVVARRPPGNVVAALPLTVLDRSRDALDLLSRRVQKPTAVQVLRRLSGLLGGVAGAVEHVPPLTHGEDRSTRRHRGHPSA